MEQNTDATTRTGRSRLSLLNSLKEDFSEITSALKEIEETAEKLAVESVGISGLPSYWRSFLQGVKTQRTGTEKKLEQVVGDLSGRGALPQGQETKSKEVLPPSHTPIKEYVDPTFGDRFKELRNILTKGEDSTAA